MAGCEKYIGEYFHKKPEFVAAWRNYGKNVIVTMPAIWEMSSDASNAKTTPTSSRAWNTVRQRLRHSTISAKWQSAICRKHN